MLAQAAVAHAGIGHGIKQHGGGNGFDQKTVQARLVLRVAPGEHLPAMGGHHDRDGAWGLGGYLLQPLNGLPAVHAGHLPVHEDGLVGGLGGMGALGCQRNGCSPVVGHIDLPAPGLRHAQQDGACGGVVIDHQHAQGGEQAFGGQGGLLGHLPGHAQGKAEVKGAALAQRAVQAQLPAHQGDQAFANGQAQASAAKTPGGGGLGLGEAVKDVFLVLRGDANAAVAHGNTQRDLRGAVCQHLDLHQHLAVLGELDGIAPQVDEHLLQPHGVARQRFGDAGVDVKEYFHGLVAHTGREDDREVAHQAVKAKGLQVEFHLACIDLGEVQDVVEQAKQGLGGAFGLVGVVELAGGQVGVLQQAQHAQDGVHGRAYLVAHVGQKLALGQRRSLRYRLGLLQGLLELLNCGDVGADADILLWQTVRTH